MHLIAAYADDLIIIMPEVEVLTVTLSTIKNFFKQRLMKMKESKSEIVCFGSFKLGKSFENIPVKLSARYLGVYYNRTLNYEFTIKAYDRKIAYIFHRLFPILKKADLKTKFNLWQIFIKPLLNMTLTTVGYQRSGRASKCFETYK